MHLSTRLLRSLVTPAEPGAPLHNSPVFASAFHVPGPIGDAPYSYARHSQPSWTTLEAALGLIEAGQDPHETPPHVLCFGSGMAAVSAVFGTFLRPGDAVVLPSNAYFTARVLAESYFAAMGISVRLAPTAGNAQGDYLDGARLLWLETPSNPRMDVADIRALVERARHSGTLVACDNTTATPLAQNCLALGADLSVVADTKLITGHHDLLLGHVATRQQALYEQLLSWRNLAGSGPGPMEAWLATRSLLTLPLRFERSSSNALALAQWLQDRPEVREVLYPGLPSHPGHAIAAAQMSSFGSVISFTLADEPAAERFLHAAQLLTNATSFGGVTSSAERRARWGGDVVEPGFIRLSVGCEELADLKADLSQALEAAAR